MDKCVESVDKQVNFHRVENSEMLKNRQKSHDFLLGKLNQKAINKAKLFRKVGKKAL